MPTMGGPILACSPTASGGQFMRSFAPATLCRAFTSRPWGLRQQAKHTLATARSVYFRGLPAADEIRLLQRDAAPRISILEQELSKLKAVVPGSLPDEYAKRQAAGAMEHVQRAKELLPELDGGVSSAALRSLHEAQIQLELAAEALAAEPPPRAMNCGSARLSGGAEGPAGDTLVFDAKNRCYVIFGRRSPGLPHQRHLDL